MNTKTETLTESERIALFCITRAEAAERKYQGEYESAVRQYERAERAEAEAEAEAECETLRAEVERLRAESWQRQSEGDDKHATLVAVIRSRDAAESRLADANALLERLGKSTWQTGDLSLPRDVKDYLAAQPATAPTRAEAECETLRAEVERLREEGSCGDPYECWKEMRGQLADANATIDRVRSLSSSTRVTIPCSNEIIAALAAQPATAPTRAEHCPGCDRDAGVACPGVKAVL